jgi:hypothetical protein
MHSIVGKLTLEAIESAAELSGCDPIALVLALADCARE